jgi:flagellar biosynthesis/type III secretory pathway protein FliH
MKLTCKECEEELEFEELDLSKEEILVKPCKNCLSEAQDGGYEAGQDAGSDYSYDEGYKEGNDEGYKDGKQEAEDFWQEKYAADIEEAKETAYANGFQDGKDEANAK